MNRATFLRGVLPRTGDIHRKVKKISADGRLGPHAELVVFGTWLILDKMPGYRTPPGKRPDLRRLLKVAAAAFAALLSSGEVRANQKVATKHVTEFWGVCFGEVTTTSDHSAALRSLRLILPAYLAHLKAGQLEFEGVKVTGSPKLTRLARALETSTPVNAPPAPGATASAAAQSSGPMPSNIAAPPSVAAPSSFEIVLGYSSPAAQSEYRNLAATSAPLPSLGYIIMPLKATRTTHKLRADRAGKVMFTPVFDVKKIRVKALIDRLAFTVSQDVQPVWKG